MSPTRWRGLPEVRAGSLDRADFRCFVRHLSKVPVWLTSELTEAIIPYPKISSRSGMGSDADNQVRVPLEEVDALIDAVTVALDLAHQGRAAEGYAVLLEGCRRAQETSTGQPWEGALLERWRGVLERYGPAVASREGVRRGATA